MKDIISTFPKLQYAFALLTILLVSTSTQGQSLGDVLECARIDTFDVHPASTPSDISAFIAFAEEAKDYSIQPSIETLEKLFKVASNLDLPSERVSIANLLLNSYYYEQLELSRQVSLAMIVANNLELLQSEKQSPALNLIGNISASSGDYISALAFYQKAYETADSLKPLNKLYPLGNLAWTYLSNGDTATAKQITHRSIKLAKLLDSPEEVSYNNVYDYTALGDIYLAQNLRDSAKIYLGLASANGIFFAPDHGRFREMQVTHIPSLIRLNIKEKNSKVAIQLIDSLEKLWPELSLLLEAEYYESIGQSNKALALTSTPIKTELGLDKKRVEFRRKLATSLGLYDIANEASSQLLTIAENDLTRSKKELVSISKAQMEASEQERKVEVNRYENKLELLQTRQRNGVAIALIILSLGIAIWFNQRFRKSQRRSLNLSKIVTQHEKDLIIANEQLALKVSSMERFNHLLSHDLREPLRSISGFTSILKRKAKPYEELQEDFGMLSRSVEQLAYLMTGVEHLRRVEERKVSPKEFDLREVVDKVIKDVKSKYDNLSINITTKGNYDLIVLDKNLLYKSLLELVDNGVKFCTDEVAHVTIETILQDGKLVIYVQDEGIGMQTAFSEQIFGIFKRLNRREKFVGSGVGLAMAKLAAEKCNGSVELLESQVGMGSTFQLALPIPNEKLALKDGNTNSNSRAEAL